MKLREGTHLDLLVLRRLGQRGMVLHCLDFDRLANRERVISRRGGIVCRVLCEQLYEWQGLVVRMRVWT